MIRYKVDILAMLKAKGYSTYRIRREKILPEATLQRFRENRPPDAVTLNKLCTLLKCQPGKLIEWIPDDSGSAESAEE